jgi:hypothetical protein
MQIPGTRFELGLKSEQQICIFLQELNPNHNNSPNPTPKHSPNR